MPAILQRLFYGADGKQFPEVQNLHREEALFAEDERSWRPCAERGAHRFATLEQAEAARAEHSWTDATGHVVKPFAVIASGPDMDAVRRREEDRLATALQSERPTLNAQRPTPKGEPGNETGFNDEPKGVAPQHVAAGTHHERRRAAKKNRAVAAVRKVQRAAAADASLPPARTRTAADFAQVYRERCAGRHVSPAESYAELERRHLD
jgi:hypothetical protein